MDTLAEALGEVLRSFRLRMAQRPQLKKAPTLALVTRQVESLEETLKDTTGFKDMVSARQKEASRRFVPTIASWMSPAYAYCAGEKGKACSHPEDACVY
jgi:hypothetical protein